MIRMPFCNTIFTIIILILYCISVIKLLEKNMRVHRGHHHRTNGNYSQRKIHKVMSEFKHGKLHSGSKRGPIVTNSRQAIAIAISESKRRR